MFLVGDAKSTFCKRFVVARCFVTGGEQLDTRCDVVNVFTDMLWHMVLFTSDVRSPGRRVFPHVVLGFEKSFNFSNFGIELEPLLIG